MKIRDLKKNWKELIGENTFLKTVVLLLLLVVGFMAVSLASKSTVVTVAPPNFTKSFEVGKDTASKTYFEAWALSIAELMGNVTAQNLPFVIDSLSFYMSPVITVQMRTQLEEDVFTMKEDGVTITFKPTSILTENATGKVFVSGNATITTIGLAPTKTVRTYEFMFDVVNYKPVVVYYDAYNSVAKTKEYLARLAAQQQNQGVMQ